MRFKILTIILFLFAAGSFAQSVSEVQFQRIKKRLPAEKDKAKKADLLYNAATYYTEAKAIGKDELENASLLNKELFKLGNELKLSRHIALSLLLEGKIESEKGDPRLGVEFYKKSMDHAKRNALKSSEASACYELGRIYNDHEYNDSCIKYSKLAVKIKKQLKRKDIYRELTLIANSYWSMSRYQEALAFGLEAEKISQETTVELEWLTHIYNGLGMTYAEINADHMSFPYYEKALATARKDNNQDMITLIIKNIGNEHYRNENSAKALEVLSELNYYAGKDCNTQDLAIHLILYRKVKQYAKAKPYYEQLLKCDYEKNTEGPWLETAYQAILFYLLETGQAHDTYAYVDKLTKLAKANNNLTNLSVLEYSLFKIDSIKGNYIGAMEHLKSYKRLNDSIFNRDSAKQLNELHVKYETEKKNKNIKLLTQQGKFQEVKIRNATIVRYVFIGSLGVLFIFVALLYNRSRLKQRAHKALELKQHKINEQNDQLKKLLIEKEWLVKEIHHRVKNNLQVVISLLNTQSGYLKNKDALMAIQNSQNRMHAMSLIHQKLYQSDNLDAIDISWYIHELVNHLKESFNTDQKISFNLDTESIKLEVTQAVPLGLILNEAISNAMKYAFSGKDKGEIYVSMKRMGGDSYRLIVSDDGVGLPENFESLERESLGMDLMIGLTDQLDGNFEIKNRDGLSIAITFSKKKPLVDIDPGTVAL